MKITFTALCIIIAACMFAGIVFDRGILQPREHHSSKTEKEDTSYTYQQRSITTKLPESEFSGASTGISVNTKRTSFRRVSTSASETPSGDSVGNAPIIDTVIFYVTRKDTLKNGVKAVDTVLIVQNGDSVYVKLKYAPINLFVKDTVIFVRDSVTLRDSIIVHDRPSFVLEIKQGFKYPSANIGSILAYGAELSYARGPWTYSIEPYVQSFKPGVALWLKYKLF